MHAAYLGFARSGLQFLLSMTTFDDISALNEGATSKPEVDCPTCRNLRLSASHNHRGDSNYVLPALRLSRVPASKGGSVQLRSLLQRRLDKYEHWPRVTCSHHGG